MVLNSWPLSIPPEDPTLKQESRRGLGLGRMKLRPALRAELTGGVSRGASSGASTGGFEPVQIPTRCFGQFGMLQLERFPCYLWMERWS